MRKLLLGDQAGEEENDDFFLENDQDSSNNQMEEGDKFISFIPNDEKDDEDGANSRENMVRTKQSQRTNIGRRNF